jgi:hypothetical protein
MRVADLRLHPIVFAATMAIAATDGDTRLLYVFGQQQNRWAA